MSAEPTTVASFWHGGPLSGIEWLALASFVRPGYRVRLYSYLDLEVPSGVVLCDARDVLPESALFKNIDRPGSFALFSNWFRYQVMSDTGCTWIDTDVVLIGPSLPETPYLFGWEDGEQINGAVLRFPRESALQNTLLEQARALERPEARSVAWGTYGPKLLTRSIQELDLTEHALPAPALYPIHYRDAWRLFDPRSIAWCRARVEGAAVVHLWNSQFADLGIKSSAPPEGSFIRELMARYGIEPDGPELDASWARRLQGSRWGRLRRGIHRRATAVRQAVSRRIPSGARSAHDAITQIP